MFQRNAKSQESPIQRLSAIGFFFLLFCLVALPACATNVQSTLRTGIFNVVPDQTLIVNFADVADSSNTASQVEIKFLDGDGNELNSVSAHVLNGKSLELRIKGEEIPASSPGNRVRIVVNRLYKLGTVSQPITTIELHNDLGLTTEGRFSHNGPGATEDDDEPEVICPGVWEADTIIN